MQTTHHSPTALAYAQSLLDLATDQNQAEPIGKELAQLRGIVKDQPTFAAYLADPGIGTDERARTLDHVFAGQVSPLLKNFLGVLNLKNRLRLLAEISDTYDDLLDERLGKVEVDVTVAHRLSSQEFDTVRQQVSAALKKDAVIHVYTDESIIGGMILRVGDKLIDASVRKQLQTIKENMLSARPR